MKFGRARVIIGRSKAKNHEESAGDVRLGMGLPKFDRGFEHFFKFLNHRLPLELRSDWRETLGKRVSDDSQHLIF